MVDAVIDLAGLARLRETRKRHEDVCIIDTFGWWCCLKLIDSFGVRVKLTLRDA
jgi:hypothetical protein